jgi:hypothetical protein
MIFELMNLRQIKHSMVIAGSNKWEHVCKIEYVLYHPPVFIQRIQVKVLLPSIQIKNRKWVWD